MYANIYNIKKTKTLIIFRAFFISIVKVNKLIKKSKVHTQVVFKRFQGF